MDEESAFDVTGAAHETEQRTFINSNLGRQHAPGAVGLQVWNRRDRSTDNRYGLCEIKMPTATKGCF
jgi:hypothetical protein